MALPDNRIRFPSNKIDFDAEVGVTGQDHDNYPLPNSQARFDWMRMIIIGLLSHQASETEPSEYRDGTVWFDLNSNELKIWMGGTTDGAWQPISKAIIVGDPPSEGSDAPTLWDLNLQVKALETRIAALE